MKNMLVGLMLTIASITHAPVFAEVEEGADQTSVVEEKSDTDKGARINVNWENDELSTDEKFEIAKKAIEDAVGGEFSKEIALEIEGLSDEDKKELVSALEEGFPLAIDPNRIPAGALAIAIPAVVLIFGMPIFIVLLVLWFGHKKRRQKMEVINAYLQADREVPDQVLNAFDVGAKSSLRRGIMLTGLGLGILAAFNGFNEPEIGALGLIPLFIGLARLVYWFIEDRKT